MMVTNGQTDTNGHSLDLELVVGAAVVEVVAQTPHQEGEDLQVTQH